MSSTTVLIIGANRGIGKGMLERYLLKPNHIVIAGNRNPDHSTSKAVANLPAGQASRLIVVKIDAFDKHDPFTAAKNLQELHGINHLDIVIANAGIALPFPTVADIKLPDLQLHMSTNAYGIITLYQAMRPLLQNSTKDPAFITLGSKAGCISDQPPVPNALYGPSKAVAHWLTAKINAEDAWLNAFVLAPGLTDTDMGRAGTRAQDLTDFPMIPIGECCDGMMRAINASAKESHGGRLILWSGEEVGW